MDRIHKLKTDAAGCTKAHLLGACVLRVLFQVVVAARPPVQLQIWEAPLQLAVPWTTAFWRQSVFR